MSAIITTKKGLWLEVQKAVEAGATCSEAAVRFGVTVSAIRSRSYRGKWKTPHRKFFNGGEATPCEERNAFADAPARPQVELAEIADNSALIPHRSALLAAADHSPEAFQSALKTLARTALAEGAAQLPIPRTIGEYRQMVAVLEAAEKMGNPTGNGNALRPATRLVRAPIEAEIVPEVDGFRI